MRTLSAAIGGCVAVALGAVAQAQVQQAVRFGDQYWMELAAMPAPVTAGRAWVRPAEGREFQLDFAGVKRYLAAAPMEFAGREPLAIMLPNPDGEFSYFEVVESPVVHPQLGGWMAAQGAEVRTFVGQGLDDPTATIRLDWTHLGFHAQVLGAEGDWAVDPYTFGDTAHYTTYRLPDLAPHEEWECHVPADNSPPEAENPFTVRATGTTLRSYDMAVAATASYTTFYAGAVAAQAGIVTTINRVNQIYERDFCMRFILVANNQNLIYTTANPGPYTDGNLGEMLDENQANINSVIGSTNYDIGHVFSAMNLGGLAQRPAICGSGKARGGTGLGTPSGDYFNVKYVGHEIGHQCNANHSFNAGDGSTCQNNRASSAAYEPGSGSTIMSYQGLCGSANNMTNWDTMFNQGAYANVDGYINGSGNCGTNTATGNSLPVIPTVTARSIPVGTAFSASATATDTNGDALTYSWEQRNLGAAQPETGAGSEDNGASPLFRVFAPVTTGTRFFPRYEDVLDGVVQIGEQYPAVGRSMTLRLLVRDNRAGGGAVATRDVTYTVVGTAGPFRINVLNSAGGVVEPGAFTLTWDVANTNVSPISTANVRILMSTDGGQTWPLELAASTPNDGSHTVTVPSLINNTCRFRIEAINNVYYDVNDANFGLGCPVVTNVLATDSTLCDRVAVTWSPVAGATSYRVLRGTSADPGAATEIAPAVVAVSLQDLSAAAGVQYWYWVRMNSAACASGGPVGTADMGRREVTTGIVTNPSDESVGAGGTAQFTVGASGAGLGYQWQRDSEDLTANGRFSGVASATLTISNAEVGDSGVYRCVVSGLCGADVTSGPATLTVTGGSACDSIDFNNDGLFPDTLDLDDFLSVFGGGGCSNDPNCSDIDFNNDGLFPDTLDIDSLLSVFGGGECL